ncbi:4Fe-4S dicluster domain-containing protein [Ramlibacter sp. AW1]|uniref:4Fe-4S dicluster domain-containing protein n=1 Tax=Ramlibacter aurantiacus TaxID=2801330 RepID=A0A936ZX73_9BURK|nr:4Fe-4S double cluster binding domain-containing protein [Ramlibacter aurantiacus]MBL0422760.1 4Fe-4S dicluster domain-containing protein [Ramlibacter aurantiacus]
MRIFSYRDRPVHLGPYPLERLTRQAAMPSLDGLPPMQPLSFQAEDPESLSHAMARYMAMFDLVRDGVVNPQPGEVPADRTDRANHLKAAGYYYDATMMAVAALPPQAILAQPIRNPRTVELASELERTQPKSFAAGMDMILADVLESARLQPGPVDHHGHAIVIAIEYPRDPAPGEPGTDWIVGTQAQRAALLGAQTAVLLSTYLRMLGFSARAHTATCSDVDLGKLAVAAGLAHEDGSNPYLGKRYGLAAVTTSLEMEADQPLAPASVQRRWDSHGPAWLLGKGTLKNAFNREAYAKREFRQGAYPFETLKRREEPTTFIDHERVPRFPKRADFFARALFGDLGKDVQENAKNAFYVMKSPIGACARRALGALLLLQFGEARGPVSPSTADPQRNADNLKAASYYLGMDAVGLCAIPEWAYYSHDAGGNPMPAYHRNAVNLLLDQGHETMEGCSGDDWISVAQSMRAYLRFSMLGGVIAEQVRRLGYSARVHSVVDGDVLQPPLLLLSGLGEVSRIGEVILNPFLGPRLKSGTVSTDLPMAFDKPIDFGLQRFCESCNKCARECPSGAITAGPKVMYNGYEIWKSDAEKCARYRINNSAGGMCGRCMKTCPWNLEGLFAESGVRWVAMHFPASAGLLARLDDALDRGTINPVKKWWWDIELDRASGRYVQAAKTNHRGLNKQLKLRHEDQTLAVYPADKMPPPYPVVHPVNREEGIERYRSLLTPEAYRQRLREGRTDGLAPAFRMPEGEPPVFPVVLKRREEMAEGLARYEFTAPDGAELPAFEAGAHIDVVIAPEYQRAYSLAGDPADRSRYVLGVLREPPDQGGRGGSALMHRAFKEGRRVFVSRPANHFPLQEEASVSLLFAGGIGVTPMLAMAHRLHALGKPFVFHYSAASRTTAGFLKDLAEAPWHDRVHYHFKDEGQRADLMALIPDYPAGAHLYTCGAARYMDGVFEAAAAHGWPEEALHREYFAVPEQPPAPRLPFMLRLTRSDRVVPVAADRSAADALIEVGIPVDMKCSDGICGVCAVGFDAAASCEVDHRDFVLSNKERQGRIVLCCSRAKDADGEIAIAM